MLRCGSAASCLQHLQFKAPVCCGCFLRICKKCSRASKGSFRRAGQRLKPVSGLQIERAQGAELRTLEDRFAALRNEYGMLYCLVCYANARLIGPWRQDWQPPYMLGPRMLRIVVSHSSFSAPLVSSCASCGPLSLAALRPIILPPTSSFPAGVEKGWGCLKVILGGPAVEEKHATKEQSRPLPNWG